MSIFVQSYDLPDSILLKDTSEQYKYLIWAPSQICIVLGRSNKAETSLFVAEVLKDHIPVYQRPTGGHTVLLSPNMLSISTIKNSTKQLLSKKYFSIYNQKIISGLKQLGVENLETQGISDIAIGNRKIAGTAMYRNREKIFYHAILNVAEDTKIFEKYLKYPSRVPEYRKDRPHSDFVTSLKEQGYNFSLDEIKKNIAHFLSEPPQGVF